MIRSFSIIPTLSVGLGYQTMLDCISRNLHYKDYVSKAKSVPTLVVHEEAYYLAQELLNAEIAFNQRPVCCHDCQCVTCKPLERPCDCDSCRLYRATSVIKSDQKTNPL